MIETAPVRAEEAHPGGKESPEVFEKLDVGIRDPERDKHFMVGFAMTIHDQRYTKRQQDAYVYAIDHILEEAGLRPFHQIGLGNESGMQAWEVWNETDKGFLEKLIPLIHEVAEEYDREMRELGVSDAVDEVINS